MAQADTGFSLEDSGKRQEFSTGSRRDTAEGKPRPDLISPYLKLRLGNHLGLGACKYTTHNWARGQDTARARESLERHMMLADMGLNEEDHLSAALFNLMIMVHNQEMHKLGALPPELNNWPVKWALHLHGGDSNHPIAETAPTKEQLAAEAKACADYMEKLRLKIRIQIVEELKAAPHARLTDAEG